MSSNTRWTPQQLRDKGLIEVNGQYVKASSQVAKGRVDKIEPGIPMLNSAIDFKAPGSYHGTAKDKFLIDEVSQWQTVIINSGFEHFGVIYDIDRRDMDAVATKYLIDKGDKITKKAIAGAIKDIRRQEAEYMLMTLNPLSQFYVETEVRSTKNHKQILKRKDGTRFVGKAFATQRQEKITAWSYKQLAETFKDAIKDKPYPLFLKFTFIMSTDASFDFQNLAQGPLDQMQTYGCIRNDNRFHVVPVYDPCVYIHPEKAGLVITVL